MYYIDDKKLRNDTTNLLRYDMYRININIKSTFGIHVTTSTYKAVTPAVYGMYITNTNSLKMSKKDMKHVFRHKITRQTRISQYQCMEMKNSRDFLCFNSCTRGKNHYKNKNHIITVYNFYKYASICMTLI